MKTDMLAELPDFLTTPAGVAVLAVVAVLLVILVLELNYKIFAKYLLDFIFSLIATVILSPVLITAAVAVKVKYGDVFSRGRYIGAKGKVITLRSFNGLENGLKNLPRILDVLAGKLSIVGPKIMKAGDAALIDDEAMARFNSRPGLVCPLVTKGNAEITYEEMFETDARYVKKREMFGDFYILLRAAVNRLRGEDRSYLGETAEKSYAEALLERGAITENDVKTAEEYAEQSERDLQYATQSKFKRR